MRLGDGDMETGATKYSFYNEFHPTGAVSEESCRLRYVFRRRHGRFVPIGLPGPWRLPALILVARGHGREFVATVVVAMAGVTLGPGPHRFVAIYFLVEIFPEILV